MKKIIKVWSFLLMVAITSVSCSSDPVELTEKHVKNLISMGHKAINNMDADKISAMLSDDVAITLNIEMMGQSVTLEPSKEEYIAMIKESWEQYQDHSYDNISQVINIQNGKAFVSSKNMESMSIQGQHISGISDEEAVIELISGQLLITNVVGYVTM